MEKIRNVNFQQEDVKANDIFICTVGYEERSRYLLNKMRNIVCNDNILVLYFDDLKESKEIMAYIEEKNSLSIKTVNINYEQGEDVAEIIISFLDGLKDFLQRRYRRG